MKVAVIIPFYQREPGLLAKAIHSIFAQELSPMTDLWVIVVDDSSPVAAADELAALAAIDRNRVTLLTQPNGGPGDARNRGLDLVAAQSADYVAFLDSDDVWKPNHLHDALDVLETGYDFYFCDHSRFDAPQTYASTIGSLKSLQEPTTVGWHMIDTNGPVITAQNSTILDAYLKDYLSQTSTVVVRQTRVTDLRFDPELRGAGEDHIYWIRLVAEGARTAISWRVNVLCGRGINIYFDAFDFGSVKAVNRIGYLCMFWYKCRELPLNLAEQKIVARMLTRYLRGYSYMFLRAVLRGQRPDMALFRTIAKRIPLMPVSMPFRFLAVLPRRQAESKLW
jgi:succinoglycan biosynthesis protein ExoW